MKHARETTRDRKWLLVALRVAVVLSPLISVLIITAVTGTSLLALDAWNSTWNDEHGYYWTINQMRLFGAPEGMTGYNEVPAPRASYGSYSPFVYIPYMLGSFVTGLSTHNFMYLINICLGILAALAVVLIARPSKRQSATIAAFFLFQFIVARYMVSGMTETSYVLFAALLASCAVWLVKHSRDNADVITMRGAHVTNRANAQAADAGAGTVAMLVAMICIVCFWGMMRPYLLAYILVPCALLIAGDFGLKRPVRIGLLAFSVVLALATLAGYLYFSKYYVTPYFHSASIANSLTDRIADACAGLLTTNVKAITFSVKSLLKLDWLGIMAFTFAAFWVALLVMAVRAGRRERRTTCALLISMVLAGFALYEANILLYTYWQLHRTLIATDVVYALLIICLIAPDAKKASAAIPGTALICVVCVLCIGALAVHPDEFCIPQVDAAQDSAEQAALSQKLADIIKHSDDAWDNTIAHPPEKDMKLYFYMPSYTALNCCQKDYMKKALRKGTLSSKYVCLPLDSKLNKTARKRYDIVYKGMNHILYQVR